MTGSLIRKVLFASVVCSMLIMVGCSKMSGTYTDSGGAVSIDFKGSKAIVNVPPAISNQEMTYDINGNEVILHPPPNAAVTHAVVLTINSDGSLSGPPPYGALKKKG
ncbi:MAG TPA: hypothetical protein VH370_11860 [Humisphaera sp.]|jgi:hypothetical protein|nr:hypothetical protein [Humisphaera sp.]